MISVAPTGRLIQGDVLDVGKASFERKLKDYDHLLYVKWNPKKQGGWGCWEVRRRPELKSIVDYAEFEGNRYLRLEYKELDHIHHVLDIPSLNYEAIRYIAGMDTWKGMANVSSANVGYWVDQFDSKAAEIKAQKEAKIQEDRNYALRQMKTQMSQLREAVLSGTNPHLIAHQMGQQKRK